MRCSLPAVLAIAVAASFVLAESNAGEPGTHLRPHRIAFGPDTGRFVGNAVRDSIGSEFDTLLVEHLRSTGVEVVDPAVGRTVGRRLVDSLGGLFSPRTGHVDGERSAIMMIGVITALLEAGADGLLYWGIGGSSAAQGYSLVVRFEDREGHEVYRDKAYIAAGASLMDALANRDRNRAAVEAVLGEYFDRRPRH